MLRTGGTSRGVGGVVCCVNFAGFVCLFVLVCVVVCVVCFNGHLCVLSILVSINIYLSIYLQSTSTDAICSSTSCANCLFILARTVVVTKFILIYFYTRVLHKSAKEYIFS